MNRRDEGPQDGFAVEASPANPRSSAQLAAGGAGSRVLSGELVHRLDGPHFPLGSLPVSTFQSAIPSADASQRPELGLLKQTADLVAHLQKQWRELDERETDLRSRQSDLEELRTKSTVEVEQAKSEWQVRTRKLAERESELAQKIQQLDQSLIQADAKRRELEGAASEFARQKANLKAVVDQELQIERDALAESRVLIAQEQSKLAELIQLQIEQQQQLSVKHEETLKYEREKLWQDLASEWETNRIHFARQQAEWHAERDQEQARLDRQKLVYENALAKVDEEVAIARASQLSELAALKEEHSAHLANEQTAWQREKSTQMQELQRERTQWETRLRFQQQHLEKLRAEFEEQQQQAKVERQREQTRIMAQSEVVELQMKQLAQVRTALELREQSLDREQQALVTSRSELLDTLIGDRTRFEQDAALWESERLSQQAELARQRDLLTQHGNQLETRRLRLDALRAELEQTHRLTLETRLAVEEAWARIAETVGSEATEAAITAARQAVEAHYDTLKQGIEQQRAELAEAIRRFELQQKDFQQERQTLTSWIHGRDEALATKECEVEESRKYLVAQEQKWQSARDQWLMDKLEAESVIRKLLPAA
jgi:hypothetical protein